MNFHKSEKQLYCQFGPDYQKEGLNHNFNCKKKKHSKECCCNECSYKKFISAKDANIVLRSGNSRVCIDASSLSDQGQASNSNTSTGLGSSSRANPMSNSNASGIDGIDVSIK